MYVLQPRLLVLLLIASGCTSAQQTGQATGPFPRSEAQLNVRLQDYVVTIQPVEGPRIRRARQVNVCRGVVTYQHATMQDTSLSLSEVERIYQVSASGFWDGAVLGALPGLGYSALLAGQHLTAGGESWAPLFLPFSLGAAVAGGLLGGLLGDVFTRDTTVVFYHGQLLEPEPLCHPGRP